MKRTPPTAQEIENVVRELSTVAEPLGNEMQTYFAYNRGRYVALAAAVAETLALLDDVHSSQPVRLLDIGPGYQTIMFRRLWPDLQIDTLGFPDDKFPPAPNEHRTVFDLNDASDQARWPALGNTYNVISYCEVVEHLYTSPVHSFNFLAAGLAPNGLMLVTTPNGIALHRRLRLLLGRNPQELIREDLSNPGHYREYSRMELIELARHAGLSHVFTRMGHYTTTGSLSSRVFGALTPFMPMDLRKDMTIVFRKQSDV
ncbi:MAG: methyltransferase domain-containing protein [Gemmatimonadaceae bacterium]